MKLADCHMCSLSNSREHICLPFGKRPANVMIIIGKKATTETGKINEQGFLDFLKRKFEKDYYVTYAIKCFVKGKIKIEHLVKCRNILKMEIKNVKPYLIVLVGKIAVISILGSKYAGIYQNVFFIKDKNRIFVCERFDGDRSKLMKNVKHLEKYITEYYK